MLFSVCGCDARGDPGCDTTGNMVVMQGANMVVVQGGNMVVAQEGNIVVVQGGGTCMVLRQGGTQGKKIANPINANENHTIWLLKEVHHEKPNQSLSEIIVIQVVLCTIIVPGLMNKEPPQFTTSLQACTAYPNYLYMCICTSANVYVYIQSTMHQLAKLEIEAATSA